MMDRMTTTTTTMTMMKDLVDSLHTTHDIVGSVNEFAGLPLYIKLIRKGNPINV